MRRSEATPSVLCCRNLVTSTQIHNQNTMRRKRKIASRSGKKEEIGRSIRWNVTWTAKQGVGMKKPWLLSCWASSICFRMNRWYPVWSDSANWSKKDQRCCACCLRAKISRNKQEQKENWKWGESKTKINHRYQNRLNSFPRFLLHSSQTRRAASFQLVWLTKSFSD